MTQRYYVSTPISPKGKAILDSEETHHLLKVMRKKVGEEIQLFDGSLHEYRAVIESIHRNHVELAVLESWPTDTESAVEITIASALPKGERQRWMIEKLTELGCRRLIPLNTEHSVARANHNVRLRLQRCVIEASKQCGRSKLMEISETMTIQQLQGNIEPLTTKLILHPISNENTVSKPLHQYLAMKKFYVLIGPEGGFSTQEIQTAMDHGWELVDLGSCLLRTETAAVAVCAALGLLCASTL